MDLFVLVALIGVALLLAEPLLPTGGVLAALGAAGLAAGGVIALTADSGLQCRRVGRAGADHPRRPLRHQLRTSSAARCSKRTAISRYALAMRS